MRAQTRAPVGPDYGRATPAPPRSAQPATLPVAHQTPMLSRGTQRRLGVLLRHQHTGPGHITA